MKKVKCVDAFIGEKHVGTLAETDRCVAFEYSDEWLDTGYSISPLSLPLNKRLYIPEYQPLDGVYGVFSDTLPDGWGRFVVDRYIMKKFRIHPDEVTSFQRLMLISDNGLGALSYKPSIDMIESEFNGDYDKIANECISLMNEESVDDLDSIFRYGGSSGGARPKIHTKINGEDWLIKFPASNDSKDIGMQEYKYGLCAKQCGIEMSDIRLFDSKLCAGYFGTKRFDRISKSGESKRVHTVSAGGLLETSHRYPNLDYHQLAKLTMIITQDTREVEKLFDLMCFNVYAHNRDDHSKNFSFMFDEDEWRWKLAPAYDLTYSNSTGGEHATTIDGEGKEPSTENILNVAKSSGLNLKKAEKRANEIEEIVKALLHEYLK